jgi:hypothetical protein
MFSRASEATYNLVQPLGSTQTSWSSTNDEHINFTIVFADVSSAFNETDRLKCDRSNLPLNELISRKQNNTYMSAPMVG